MNRFRPILLALLMFLTSSAWGQNARVEVITVSIDPVVYRGFSENSTLEAVDEVTLNSVVTARLTAMLVKQGDQVTLGTPVAELDHRQVDARIAQAQAQIAVAQAQLAQTTAQLDNAKLERDRYRRLVQEGFSTQQQLDAKETAYRTAAAAVELNRAQVRQSRANLQALQVDLSEYTIKASIPGTVVNDYSRTPGEMITAQTPLVQIADTTRLKAVIQAPESQTSTIAMGMAAFVIVGDRKLTGHVYRIRPFVDPATRTTQVEVTVDDPDPLKPGMFARVFIVQEALENAVMIPTASVRREEGADFVMVARDGKANRRSVQLGATVGDRVQILEGLAPGETLIVSGGRTLTDGEAVDIKEETV
ncbi:MAG: hypothetical protein CSA35_02155 [Dethiosulfovibrio peptidovorans]|nr:MAG: hypothetical protein CSA35_02155 [Dethiosulfovibrio peptidovorans]